MTKNFNKEELDRAYNNSLAVPNSAKLTQYWTDKSSAVRKDVPGELNIAYGDSPRQRYDYFSAGNDSPIIVFIHGGFWQRRSKDDFTFIVPSMLEQDFSVVLLGYRLAPQAKMNEIILDIQNGLHAIEHKVRGERKTFPGFYLVGWSAGAHLAASVLDQPNVNAGVGISGIYNLEPMRHCYVNDLLQLDADMALKYSPMMNASHFGKPFDLLVGDNELTEMQKQTIDFFKYRNSRDEVGSLILLEGLNHFTVLDELIKNKGIILRLIKESISKKP
jgi:arylformamidase